MVRFGLCLAIPHSNSTINRGYITVDSTVTSLFGIIDARIRRHTAVGKKPGVECTPGSLLRLHGRSGRSPSRLTPSSAPIQFQPTTWLTWPPSLTSPPAPRIQKPPSNCILDGAGCSHGISRHRNNTRSEQLALAPAAAAAAQHTHAHPPRRQLRDKHPPPAAAEGSRQREDRATRTRAVQHTRPCRPCMHPYAGKQSITLIIGRCAPHQNQRATEPNPSFLRSRMRFMLLPTIALCPLEALLGPRIPHRSLRVRPVEIRQH